jgi:glucose/arabinose dehydrogenase
MSMIKREVLTAVSAAAVVAVGLTAAVAQQQPPRPGWSLIDKSNPAASQQDTKLAPHATPPTVTALDKIPVDKIKLPPGFKAEVWSHGHPGGRAMAEGPKGTIFMGTRQIGRVYAITNKDGKREVKTLLQGLTQPAGLAVKDGALYVFAINKVWRYDNIEDKLDNPGQGVELTEAYNLPPDAHHNWKYVAFGPDNKIYVPIGAHCNICELNPGLYGQIRRYNADGTGMEIIARGVRNTVGFDWHPTTGDLWFTDHGRDWAGDNGPEDELNRLTKANEGANFGFPYCHANGIPDQDIKIPNACAGVTLPVTTIGPHAAGMGVKFYTGTMFPEQYRNVAFIARRGSWNRAQKIGYDVLIARIGTDGSAKLEPFMTGLLDEAKNEFLGRPVYIHQMRDGSLLVSDEQNGAVYRISHQPQRASN